MPLVSTRVLTKAQMKAHRDAAMRGCSGANKFQTVQYIVDAIGPRIGSDRFVSCVARAQGARADEMKCSDPA